MADYLLTRHELITIINLNYEDYYRGFLWNNSKEEWDKPDEYIQSVKPDWDRFIFNNLLIKQPELKPDIDIFWEKAKKHQYLSTLFWQIFENKILLKNVYPLIFNCNTRYYNKSDRKKFIEVMVKHEPWVMNALHDKIKHNNYIDFAHLEAYVQLLPKYSHQIKDSKESIWNNLKKTKDFTESHFVQVLNSAVKSFPHDKDFYDFLKEQCSPKFETYHNLREKFKNIENKYFQQFKNNTEIDIFSNTQEYKYIFCIKDSILIDYFGVNKNSAIFVQKQIHEGIKKHLNEYVGSDLYYTYSGKGFEINTQNYDNYPKIEFHMEKLKDCIKDILSSLDERTKNGIDRENISNFFTRLALKFDLENSLEKKDFYKSKKAKI